MEKNIKLKKLAVLTAVLPFIYGCGAGGTSSLLGFLFGGSVIGGGTALLSGGGGGAIGGTQLATLHQPEPMSMLLLGGGLAAMAYFKSRKK